MQGLRDRTPHTRLAGGPGVRQRRTWDKTDSVSRGHRTTITWRLAGWEHALTFCSFWNPWLDSKRAKEKHTRTKGEKRNKIGRDGTKRSTVSKQLVELAELRTRRPRAWGEARPG